MIGGGNTAVEEALFLTNFASKVTVVHRRDHFRAEKILQDRLFKNPKIEVIWDTRARTRCSATTTRQGDRRRAEERQDRRAHARRAPTACSSRSAIRPRPNWCKGQLEMKPSGYVKTAPDSTATSIPGVFAAGDVTDEIYRQAVTAAGMGCMAALEAETFLAAQEERRDAAE